MLQKVFKRVVKTKRADEEVEVEEVEVEESLKRSCELCSHVSVMKMLNVIV